MGAAPASAQAADGACPALLDHRVPDLSDKQVDLCSLKGKVVLAVNTASNCGFTPQYDGLEKLWKRYRDRGLVVIGFPANDFGAQEPGTNRQIAQFCRENYGVTFPMFEKTHVVGRDAHPLFVELARRSGEAPGWNFHKYVVDRRGEKVTSFPSQIGPQDRRLVALVERLLAEAPPAR
jgi:glutathione peroxidase